MRIRSAVLAIGLALAVQAAPAQAPGESARALLVEAEELKTAATDNAGLMAALGSADAAQRMMRELETKKARVSAFLAKANAQIGKTSKQAEPVDWGVLYLAMAVAHEAALYTGAEGSERLGLDEVDTALTVLTRDNTPLEWARAQQQRASLLLFSALMAEGDRGAALTRDAAAATEAALTVFNKQDHPRKYFEIRCFTQAFTAPEDPPPEVRQRQAALLPLCDDSSARDTPAANKIDTRKGVVQRFNRALTMEPTISNMLAPMPQAPPGFGPFGGAMRKQYQEQMKQSQAAMQASLDEMRKTSGGGAIVDELSESRAAFLSASLSMEQLGLSSADLARARALRAQADSSAAQAASPAALREDKSHWRALADLLDMIAAADPPAAAPVAVDDPVIALLTLSETRGYAAVKTRVGPGAVLATEANKESVKLAAAQPQTPRMGYNPIPFLGMFSQFNASSALKKAEAQQADRQRKMEVENAALLASAEASPAEAWMKLYAAGDFPAAIDDFRKRFEPQFAPMLQAAAASAAAPGARIVIMPDGAASMLPIALLRDPKTGRALIEDYEIAYAPSLTAYESARRRARAAGQAAVAVVAPSFAESGLEFVESEAALTRAPFNAGANVEARGKAALLGQLGQASYWHFATHGYFDSANPRASWLQIPGGEKLTLGDLLFSQTALGAPRLVVLSACESGLFDTARDPDAFVGMPTGFLQAGAAGVIASLWPVSDVSATLLMAKFYDLHRSGGERPSAALRHAQLWLKDSDKPALQSYIRAAQARGAFTASQADGLTAAIAAEQGPRPYAHPYHWGAFVYYGA